MERVSNVSDGNLAKNTEMKKREEHLRNKYKNKVDKVKEKRIKNVSKLLTKSKPNVDGLKPSLEQSDQKTTHPIGHAKNKKCLLCPNFTFISVKEIREHMKAKHEIAKAKTCQKCFLIFMSQSAVNKHLCQLPEPKISDKKGHGKVLVSKKMDGHTSSVHEERKVYDPMETLSPPLDSSMDDLSNFSERQKIADQKNTSPVQDSGFGSEISASESTDSETSSYASLGKIDHEQIENQKLLDSIFNPKEAALANLGKIDHQQIEIQDLLDSIFNQKEAAPPANATAEAEVAETDEAPLLDFSPEETSYLKEFRPF